MHRISYFYIYLFKSFTRKKNCNLIFGNEYIFHEKYFYSEMTNELKCKLLDKIKVQQFTVLGLTTYFYIKKD